MLTAIVAVQTVASRTHLNESFAMKATVLSSLAVVGLVTSVGCVIKTEGSQPPQPAPTTTAPAPPPAAPTTTPAPAPAVPECTDGSSCYSLAEKYRKGDGVEKNDATAAALYAKAIPHLEKECDAMTSAFSCMHAGELHRKGLGTKKNPFRALRYYAKTCEEMSMAFTCPTLAEMLIAGEGTAKDTERAYKAHLGACAPGIYDECHKAGDLWRDGKGGVPKDPAKAQKLYQQGCTLHMSAKAQCAKEPKDCEMVGKPISCERLGKKI